MLRARSAGPWWTGGSAGTHTGPGDEGLPRANRSTINRLTRDRRRWWFWNPWTRTSWRGRHRRARGAQLLGKIRTRRDDGSRHRLTGERPRLLRPRLHGTAVLLRRLRRTLGQRRPRQGRRGRSRPGAKALGGTSRKGLSWAGENLAGSRRRARRARNRFRRRRRRTSWRNHGSRRLGRGRLWRRSLDRWRRRRGVSGSARRATFRAQTHADGRLNRFSGEWGTDRQGRRRMTLGGPFRRSLRGRFGCDGRGSGGRLRLFGRDCRSARRRFRFIRSLVRLGHRARRAVAVRRPGALVLGNGKAVNAAQLDRHVFIN